MFLSSECLDCLGYLVSANRRDAFCKRDRIVQDVDFRASTKYVNTPREKRGRKEKI